MDTITLRNGRKVATGMVLAACAALICVGTFAVAPAHATTKTIKVPVKIQNQTEAAAGTATKAITYNSKGFATKVVTNSWYVEKYKYNSKCNIKSYKCYDDSTLLKSTKVTYNSKGLYTKLASSNNEKVTFKYSGKKLTKATVNDGDSKRVVKYKVNSKGRTTSTSTTSTIYGSEGTRNIVRTIKYNSKGNIKSVLYDDKTNGFTETTTYAYKYSKGEIVSYTETVTDSDSDEPCSTTFVVKYKKVKVSTENVSKVKAQKWALLNNNYNNALPLMP